VHIAVLFALWRLCGAPPGPESHIFKAAGSGLRRCLALRHHAASGDR
jgi:hypothetical protein